VSLKIKVAATEEPTAAANDFADGEVGLLPE
jgi:hypothetical protein